MSFNLLQLVDQVSGELGLVQPASVIGSAQNQTMQFLALAQRLGRDLCREFEWQGIHKIYVFQTTAAVSQSGTTISGAYTITGLSNTALMAVGNVISGTGIASYSEISTIDSVSQITMNMPATAAGTSTKTFAAQDYVLPTDYDRMISDTNWDRTNHWMNLGAKTSQEWQTLQGGIISTGPRERYRIYRGALRIFPAVTAVYNEAFEYISNYWVLASGGTSATKEAFTLDTDSCIFKDALMAAGLKYYFLKAKRLDFSVEQAEFLDLLSTCKAQDEPLPQLSFNPIRPEDLISDRSVPEGSWNL